VILDNYIIRIYRRDKSNPRFIVGTVEEIGSREKKGFTTFEELREILVPAGGGAFWSIEVLEKQKGKCAEGDVGEFSANLSPICHFRRSMMALISVEN